MVVSLNGNEAMIRKLYIVDKDIVALRPVTDEGEVVTLVNNEIKEMNVIGKYCYAISPFLQ